MTEDYAIQIRTGRAYQKGFDNRGKKVWGYKETYKTNAGEFVPQEWREKIKEAIEQAGEMELLENLKNYCREHCAWLHKESEIEDYAMDVLASRAYLCWEGFNPIDKKKYMVFIFKEG